MKDTENSWISELPHNIAAFLSKAADWLFIALEWVIACSLALAIVGIHYVAALYIVINIIKGSLLEALAVFIACLILEVVFILLLMIVADRLERGV